MFILAQGCALKVKPEPVKVEKIVVEHQVTINTETIKFFYQGLCQTDLGPDATDEELEDCATKRTNDFIDAFEMGRTDGQEAS